MRHRLKLAAGLYLLLLFAATLDTVKAFQSVNPDTTSSEFGYLKFSVEPDTAYLYLNLNYDDLIKVTDGDSLRLPAKRHNLLIFARNIPERRISIEIAPTRTTDISVVKFGSDFDQSAYSAYASYRWDANLMVFTDDETLVSVVGTDHFSFGTLKANLPPGAYRVRFERPSGKTTEQFIEVNAYELETVEKYFKPYKRRAIAAGIIPGASQFYKGEPLKALSSIALMGSTLAATLYYDSRLAVTKDEFNVLRDRYEQTDSELAALELGDRLVQLEDDANGFKTRRNIFRIAAVLVYAANIYDAFQEPENGFASPRRFNPFRDFSFDLGEETVQARVQINF